MNDNSLNNGSIMRIEYLIDNASKIPELARLHFKEWGYLRPKESIEDRTERLRLFCGRHSIPIVVVALENDELVGSAMLIDRDMESRPHLTPWLAGVFVKPHFRGKNIGKALIKKIEDEARSLGFHRLYLYSPNAEGFYEILGWTIIEKCEYLGINVVIMSKNLFA